tara:strand:+ start:389 stop:952 length:564 start_codon:yes stop_codon:yes gene_type:complete
MKSTEILNKIKTFLGEEAIEQDTQLTEEALELAQLKLENGTVLEAEAFESGNEIFILTEDEKVAVPKGEYLMEDGNTLVVEEEGIIKEIKAEEEEVEQEEEEKEEMQYVSKQEFESAVEEIKGMIKELKDHKEKEEMAEQVKEELSSTPAVEPIAHNPEAQEKFKVRFGNNRKETALDRVMKRLTNN